MPSPPYAPLLTLTVLSPQGDVIIMLHVQVKEPHLQARESHSATATTLGPGVTEVTLFGGIPEWTKSGDLPQIANTTVLRFGESTSCVSHTSPVSCDECRACHYNRTNLSNQLVQSVAAV